MLGRGEADHSGPRPQAVVLPEGYYHTHFTELVKSAQGRYLDLLNERERAFLATFEALPEPCQKLFVRLTNRIGPWFVVGKLRYPEVGDCREATLHLQREGLLEDERGCDEASLLALLTVADLKRAFPELKRAGAGSREALVAAALALPDAKALRARILEITGAIVRPAHADTVRLLRYLYFGNTGQGMTDFVLADMGLMRYEAYALDSSTRAFDCREALEHALAARTTFEETYVALEELRETWDLDVLMAARDLALTRLATFHPRARRRLHKTLCLLGNRIERHGAAQEALACYLGNPAAPARERAVRLLDKLGRRPEALVLARDTMASSLEEAELAFAFRWLVKTAKIDPEAIPTPPGDDDPRLLQAFFSTKNTLDLWPQRKLVLPAQTRRLGVEEATLLALAEEGCEGAHVENFLWCALFGLVFWDDVFAPVAGAFHHPYQIGPNDGSSPDFAPARGGRCEETLARFASGELGIEALHARYLAKEGLANRWIFWPAAPWPLLERLLTCAPREGLARVMGRMLRHPGRFDSGFPDLAVWRDGAVEFWEVKGPGDELRPHQKSWLAFLGASGLRAGVCVVTFEHTS
jgi:hypothetical protein